MLIKKLKQLNISEKEARVYLALLELTEANMQRICDKSKVKRTTAYEAIELLKKKGLVSTTRKNKKLYYYPESPHRLGEMIDERKNIFNRILPEMLSVTNSIDKKPNIKFFEGVGGIKEVYRDTLRYPNTEILGWVSSEAITKFEKHFLVEEYTNNRIKQKMWVRVIAPRDEIMEEYKEIGKDISRKVKLVDKDKYKLDVEINIYGDSSIAIMSFSEEIALIIKSKKIHDTLKSIFEMNWAMI